MFVLTRVTFELEAIKQEKTRQFFLKFLAKKYEKVFLSIMRNYLGLSGL